MAYEIMEEKRDSMLLFTVKGEETYDANADLLLKVADELQKTGADRVVIDLRGLTGHDPGTIYNFEIAKMAKTANKIRRVEKAVLIYDASREKDTKFFEIACRLLGVNIRAFKDEKEAREWMN